MIAGLRPWACVILGLKIDKGPPVTLMLHRLFQLDRALLLRARRLEQAWLTRVMTQATRAGDAVSWVLLGAVLLALGGTARTAGQLLAVAALGSVVLSQTLKRLCRRPRPQLGIAGFAPLLPDPDMFSFPSGHTATAIAVAVALLGVAPLAGSLLAALAVTIAVSRVVLGAHYPLDVGVGALLGLIVGLASRALLT